MTILNISCLGCNHFIKRDNYESIKKAKEKEIKCCCKDCETDIDVYP